MKQRARNAVVYTEADLVAAQAGQEQTAEHPGKRKASEVTVVKVTGGKAKKTGMVLARAQLSTSTGGVVAAQQRQDSLLGKGRYRDAETLACEAPVGTLSTKDMPKRKQAKTKVAQAKHGADFRAWMKRTFKSKVRRRQCK